MQALADALDWEETEGSGDSRVKGVIVPYGQLLAMYEGKPSAEVALPRSLKDGGVQVAIMTRNSFFWSLSKAKKRYLKSEIKESKIEAAKATTAPITDASSQAGAASKVNDCENWNQRGSSACQAADSHYMFKVPPKTLLDIIKETESEEKNLHVLARWAAGLFQGAKQKHPGAYHVIRYEDVLCASPTPETGSLPPKLNKLLGMGNCSHYDSVLPANVRKRERPRIEKSSPSNPASALLNKGQLQAYANKTKQFWGSYLEVESQCDVVQSSSDRASDYGSSSSEGEGEGEEEEGEGEATERTPVAKRNKKSATRQRRPAKKKMKVSHSDISMAVDSPVRAAGEDPNYSSPEDLTEPEKPKKKKKKKRVAAPTYTPFGAFDVRSIAWFILFGICMCCCYMAIDSSGR